MGLLWVLGMTPLAAQVRLELKPYWPEERAQIVRLQYREDHGDSLAALSALQDIVIDLHRQGFLLASIDSLVIGPDTVEAFLVMGDSWKWAELRVGNVPEDLLSKAGYKQRFYQDRPFRFREFARMEENILRLSEAQGHPFARIRMDSLALDPPRISGALRYEPGPLFRFDSLRTIGSANVKSRFLMRYLRLKPGEPFDQRRVKAAEGLLRRLPYLSVKAPPNVDFIEERAFLNLYIDQRKANRFNAIVGLLPGEGDQERLLLTGEVDMVLRNLFQTGKRLMIHWQAVQPRTQQLDLGYLHPKLAGSPIDVEFTLGLLKQDTLFLNVDRRLRMAVSVGRLSEVEVTARIRSTRLLSTMQYEAATTLPDNADATYTAYGLGYRFQGLDDPFYPRRGWDFYLGSQVGNKVITRNTGIPQEAYAGIDLRSLQVTIEGSLERFLRTGKRTSLRLRGEGGVIESDNLFLGDQFRVGGLQSLRGFNENFFFASRFGLATAELRLYTDPETYLSAFFDQAYIQSRTSLGTIDDFPRGLGIGINFATQGGVFSFNYAVGQSAEQPMSVRFSKIHFGLVSSF